MDVPFAPRKLPFATTHGENFLCTNIDRAMRRYLAADWTASVRDLGFQPNTRRVLFLLLFLRALLPAVFRRLALVNTTGRRSYCTYDMRELYRCGQGFRDASCLHAPANDRSACVKAPWTRSTGTELKNMRPPLARWWADMYCTDLQIAMTELSLSKVYIR